jgi:hypothetical protein
MFEQTPTAAQELLLARELLEYAVLFSVSQKDEAAAGPYQGLTLVHFSAQLDRFLWDRWCA